MQGTVPASGGSSPGGLAGTPAPSGSGVPATREQRRNEPLELERDAIDVEPLVIELGH